MTCAGLELPKKIQAGGGGGKSSLLQFIANITKLEIGYFQIKDSTAIGVFRLLCNLNKNENNFKKIFYPDKTISLKSKKIKWRNSLIAESIYQKD